MSNIIITAESGSDLPERFARKYGIKIVPMHVTFGEEAKDDGTFLPKEICEYYMQNGSVPKTSGSSPADFAKVFDELHEKYPDKLILHMAYSAVTTCSYQSAVIASQDRDYVTCMDTQTCSLGQSAAVVRTMQSLSQEDEWTLQEADKVARKWSKKVKMCFVPQDLTYLHAGGRVSNAKALYGSILNIHPCIEIVDGYVKATKKYRGKMDKVIPRLIREYTEQNNLSKDVIWLGGTVGLSKDNAAIATKVVKELGYKKVHWLKSGGVITAHAGPGTFAMAGFEE